MKQMFLVGCLAVLAPLSAQAQPIGDSSRGGRYEGCRIGPCYGSDRDYRRDNHRDDHHRRDDRRDHRRYEQGYWDGKLDQQWRDGYLRNERTYGYGSGGGYYREGGGSRTIIVQQGRGQVMRGGSFGPGVNYRQMPNPGDVFIMESARVAGQVVGAGIGRDIILDDWLGIESRPQYRGPPPPQHRPPPPRYRPRGH